MDLELVGKEVLRGSRVIHNHPPKDKDSFSRDDFMEFFDKGLSQMEIVSGGLYNIMRYCGDPFDGARAYSLYNEALNNVRQDAKDSHRRVDMEQLEIMRQLAKTLKGLAFYEQFRRRSG